MLPGLVASSVGLRGAVGCWLCWLNPLLAARQEGWGYPRVLSPLGQPWQEVARVTSTPWCCVVSAK